MVADILSWNENLCGLFIDFTDMRLTCIIYQKLLKLIKNVYQYLLFM